MNLKQRFTLLVKGNLTALFDSLEDPERSLHQLVIDMEEQLESAKRAAAQAMANEDRLRARVEQHRKEAKEWHESARRALAKGREDDAHETMKRCELAERQVERLGGRLAEQETDTRQIRESIERMQDQLRHARDRLQVLQARMRQSEARRAIGQVMQGVERANLGNEFDRLGERVEQAAAAEAAYLRLDGELSGDNLRRRCEDEAVDDAVSDRLERLRGELDDGSVDNEAA